MQAVVFGDVGFTESEKSLELFYSILPFFFCTVCKRKKKRREKNITMKPKYRPQPSLC